METIQKIENNIEVSSDVQNAYDEFQSLIKCEMDNKLPIYNNRSIRDKSKKSRFKPYWNDVLAMQWDKVCETEKKWLRFNRSNCLKQKYKKEYCSERKTFDRLNRKFKRKYQTHERQKLEDKLCETNQRDFWKSIGKLGVANERKPCIPMAVVDENGTVNTNRNDVLNKWKADFHSLFRRNFGAEIELDSDDFNTETDVSTLNASISRTEVFDAVVRAKSRKATGIDDIPAEVLKNDTALDLLHQL